MPADLDPPPLSAALAAENRELRAALAKALAKALARIAELEARLGLSSKNSSKPPSSDGLAKPPSRSLRARGRRKPGGQPGHPGQTLAQVAVADEVVRHEPVACTGCGRALTTAPEAGTEVGQLLSKQRTAVALAELFGLPVSSGTVTAMTQRCAGRLDGFLALVGARIAGAAVAHFDETGLRVEGGLCWVHSAATATDSLLTVDHKRGTVGMDAAGVLPAFGGVAVHDAWAPYDTYTQATHALCNAHVLRELQAVTDQHPDPNGNPNDGGWCWATQASAALRELKRLVDAAPWPSTAPWPALTTTRWPASVAGGARRWRSASSRP